MTDNSVMVVALDGLDYDLIQEFGLSEVKQQEFERIDNTSGVSSRKTSELFASFITGENYDVHGIKGLQKKPDLVPKKLQEDVRGFNRLNSIINSSLDREGLNLYDKNDLRCSSLFEEIDNSRSLFVPSYEPSEFWLTEGVGTRLRSHSLREYEPGYLYDVYEFERRKEEVFRPVNKWFDFFMVHFHRPDAHQHRYGDKDLSSYDEDKLKELYIETDELLSKILRYFEESYEIIIFMSDHGLPTKNAHNKNAFYSSNISLFEDKTPKITDFYDKIIQILDN